MSIFGYNVTDPNTGQTIDVLATNTSQENLQIAASAITANNIRPATTTTANWNTYITKCLIFIAVVTVLGAIAILKFIKKK